VGHGYYRRKLKGLRAGYGIWVKRWRCRACQHTVSSLPNFQLPFRHYLVAIIERAVVTRFEQQASWKEVERQSAEQGMPVLRTLRHWGRVYAGQASAWLTAVQQALAQQDSPSPWLDAQGEALQAGSCARVLL